MTEFLKGRKMLTGAVLLLLIFAGGFGQILAADGTPPTAPNLMTTPSYVEGTFSNKSITVTAGGSIDDVTAPEALQYEKSLDGTTYEPGNSVNLSESGNFTVYFRVSDEAGNKVVASMNVKIDILAPSTPAVLLKSGEAGYVAGTWTNKKIDFSLSGSVDQGDSGLAGYQYKIDGGSFIDGTTGSISTSGDHVLSFRSSDLAGNISNEGQRNIRIDLDSPKAFTVKAEASGIDSIHVSGETIDELSGIAPNGYRLHDGKKWSAWRPVLDDWLTGYQRGEKVTIKVEVRDQAGNVTTSQISVRTLTNTVPVAVIDSFSLREDAPKTFLDVKKNDYDDDKSDAISITSVSKPDVASAGELLLEDGKIYFTPEKDYYGNFSFTYVIEDGFGGKATAVAEVSVKAVEDQITGEDDGEIIISKEPLFTTPCIIALAIASAILLLNYGIHFRFFHRKIWRLPLYVISSGTVLYLSCLLRATMGYFFTFMIMTVYVATCLIYATMDKLSNNKIDEKGDDENDRESRHGKK